MIDREAVANTTRQALACQKSNVHAGTNRKPPNAAIGRANAIAVVRANGVILSAPATGSAVTPPRQPPPRRPPRYSIVIM